MNKKKIFKVAAKLQLAAPNKRQQEDFDDNEPHSKRPHSMSPAHLQVRIEKKLILGQSPLI